MWQREPVENARADFEVAMRSDVDPAFTDRIILAAITNTTTGKSSSRAELRRQNPSDWTRYRQSYEEQSDGLLLF